MGPREIGLTLLDALRRLELGTIDPEEAEVLAQGAGTMCQLAAVVADYHRSPHENPMPFFGCGPDESFGDNSAMLRDWVLWTDALRAVITKGGINPETTVYFERSLKDLLSNFEDENTTPDNYNTPASLLELQTAVKNHLDDKNWRKAYEEER